MQKKLKNDNFDPKSSKTSKITKINKALFIRKGSQRESEDGNIETLMSKYTEINKPQPEQ